MRATSGYLGGTNAVLALLLGVLLGVLSPSLSHTGERWTPPLARSIDVSGPYRAPPHPYGSGHRGIDLPAVPGERVLSPATGTVIFAGTVVDRDTITVRTDERTVVSIEPVTSSLSVGTEVKRGSHIGNVASGGHCEAECVHVGVRVEGEYVNPMRFFAGRPVLLPWNVPSQ